MGNSTISKGDRHRALHQALLEELGDGAQLTIKQCFKIFSRCLNVSSVRGMYDQLEAMDLNDYLEWDRELEKPKNSPCVTVLPSESLAETPARSIRTPA